MCNDDVVIACVNIIARAYSSPHAWNVILNGYEEMTRHQSKPNVHQRSSEHPCLSPAETFESIRPFFCILLHPFTSFFWLLWTDPLKPEPRPWTSMLFCFGPLPPDRTQGSVVTSSSITSCAGKSPRCATMQTSRASVRNILDSKIINSLESSTNKACERSYINPNLPARVWFLMASEGLDFSTALQTSITIII